MKKHSSIEQNRWAVNESLLQSYRSCFLASQSIMLTVGAIIVDKNIYLTLIITIIAILQVIFIWMPAVKYRGFIVDFYKYNMSQLFNNKGEYDFKHSNCLQELTYVRDKKIRKKVNSKLSNNKEKFSNWRKTRVKMDIIMPLSIIMIWIVYLIYSSISYL